MVDLSFPEVSTIFQMITLLRPFGTVVGACLLMSRPPPLLPCYPVTLLPCYAVGVNHSVCKLIWQALGVPSKDNENTC